MKGDIRTLQYKTVNQINVKVLALNGSTWYA